MLNNFHMLSLGCAPTPIQYFALDISSFTSLNARFSGSDGCVATGLYVPRTSRGLEFRAVLDLISLRSTDFMISGFGEWR